MEKAVKAWPKAKLEPCHGCFVPTHPKDLNGNHICSACEKKLNDLKKKPNTFDVLENGWMVIASKPASEKHLFVVLCVCDVPDDYAGSKYATWIYNADTGGCCWGHYFEHLEDAAKDFGGRSYGKS